MATWLKNTLAFGAFAPGQVKVLPHNLVSPYGVSLTPDLVAAEDAQPIGTGITFSVLADATTVTVTNGAVAINSLNIYVESWHTIERTFGDVNDLALPIQPFYILGQNGSGGGGGPPVTLQIAYNNGTAGAEQPIVQGAGNRLGIFIQAAPPPLFVAGTSIFRVMNNLPQNLLDVSFANQQSDIQNIRTTGNFWHNAFNSNINRTLPAFQISTEDYTNQVPASPRPVDVLFDFDTTDTYLAGGLVDFYRSIEIRRKTFANGGGGSVDFDAAAVLYMRGGALATIGTAIESNWGLLVDVETAPTNSPSGNNWFRGTLTIGDLPITGGAGVQMPTPTLGDGSLIIRSANIASSYPNVVIIDASTPGAIVAPDTAQSAYLQFNANWTAFAFWRLGGRQADPTFLLPLENQNNTCEIGFDAGANATTFIIGTVGPQNLEIAVNQTLSYEVVGGFGVTAPNLGMLVMRRRFEQSRGAIANVAGVNQIITFDGGGNVFQINATAAGTTVDRFDVTDWRLGAQITVVITLEGAGTLQLLDNVGPEDPGCLYLIGGGNTQLLGNGDVIIFTRGGNGWYQSAPICNTTRVGNV